MSIKKSIVILACIVTGALAVGAGTAAASGPLLGGSWAVGGATLPAGATKTAKCHLKVETTMTLTGAIGEGLTPFELSIGGVECKKAVASSRAPSLRKLGTNLARRRANSH
jgi:hypothetical protein